MVLVGPKELPVEQGAKVTLRSLEGVPMAIAMRPNTLVTALDAATRRHPRGPNLDRLYMTSLCQRVSAYELAAQPLSGHLL